MPLGRLGSLSGQGKQISDIIWSVLTETLSIGRSHRNTENSNLQYKHLEFGGRRQQGGSPAVPHYFVLSLEKRKNWQKRISKEQQLRSECILAGLI